ncbi:MAG: ferric reductase-like transmembrane domain-containing protein, partial [Candidatus Nealsonbacteria bacterium]|nr:ferric reductase-like transmembrane domain-containing protein [Candidatus Nealsonbacteria bacterium]
MLKSALKTILILLFIAPPIAIWLLMAPLSVRFEGFSQAMRSLGQILGLSGMSLFCLVFLLKTRVRWIDSIFSGLDKAYINHHNIGGIAFVLLLFHPLALAIRFIPQSIRGAALFLVPSFSQTAILYGEIGLGLMIILLVITFFIKLKYHIWKFSHKFMALAFAFGFIHMILIPSDISQNYFLRFYLVSLALIS